MANFFKITRRPTKVYQIGPVLWKIWQKHYWCFFGSQCISGFWKQRDAILKFYFRFPVGRIRRHRHYDFASPHQIHPNRIIDSRVMTSWPFSIWRPSAMLDLLWGNSRPHTKCSCCVVFSFRLDRIYSVGDSAIFTARRYAIAVLAVIMCLSVCPSVTSRSCTKMAKHKITLPTPVSYTHLTLPTILRV